MVHLYKNGLHLNNYGKDIYRYIFTGKYFSDERFLDSQCVKNKGPPIKTNHENSAKHDSDSDGSFDISSENQQSINELDLEGCKN